MTGRHTPTPWTFAKRALRIYGGRTRDFVVAYIPVSPDYEANAKFIVRAVNSHDELVEALEGLVHAVNTPSLAAAMACHSVADFANVEEALKPALTALSHARSTDGDER